MLHRFETGKTYTCSSACDHNCVWKFEILERTAHTVKIVDWVDHKIKSKRISVYADSEFVMPLGRYALAPVLRADSEYHEPKDTQEVLDRRMA